MLNLWGIILQDNVIKHPNMKGWEAAWEYGGPEPTSFDEKELIEVIKRKAVLRYPMQFDRYNWLRDAFLEGAKSLFSRLTSLETANQFHKQAAEEAVQERNRLQKLIENGTEINSDLIEKNMSLIKELGRLEEKCMAYQLEKDFATQEQYRLQKENEELKEKVNGLENEVNKIYKDFLNSIQTNEKMREALQKIAQYQLYSI